MTLAAPSWRRKAEGETHCEERREAQSPAGCRTALRAAALGAALALSAWLTAPGPAAAQSGSGTSTDAASSARFASAWLVSGIRLEAEAESAAQAREQVFAAVGQAALQHLWARILPAADIAEPPKVADSELARWIAELRVERERYSSVRYAAAFSVRFEPEPVRAFLESAGLRYAEAVSRPVVVLPLFTEGGREPRLFSSGSNPWYEWWRRRPPDSGLVPLLVPPGDLGDISLIGPREALAKDPSALLAIARRYGARGAIVAHMDLLESDLRPPPPLAGGLVLRPRRGVAARDELALPRPGHRPPLRPRL